MTRLATQLPKTSRTTGVQPAHKATEVRLQRCGGKQCPPGTCAHDEPLTLRRQSTAERTPATAPRAVHETLQEGGQPLDAATRAFMEPRFGHDFSQVRVHTDSRASASAAAVHARAYTVGRDVVFAAGAYAPGSAQGRRLLAHELTHVLQQGGGPPPGIQAKLEIGGPGDVYEQQAERIAQQVTATAASPGPSSVEQQPAGRMHEQFRPRVNNIIKNRQDVPSASSALQRGGGNGTVTQLLASQPQAGSRLVLQRQPAPPMHAQVPQPASPDEQRTLVERSIRSIEVLAAAQIDRATVDQVLAILHSFLTHAEGIITVLRDDTLRQRLRAAYANTLRALLTRAASSLGIGVDELYLRLRYGGAALIPAWADDAVGPITTPMPMGVNPDATGRLTMTINGVRVIFLPDMDKRSAGAVTNTNWRYNNRISPTARRNGVVVSHVGPGTPEVTVRTRYGPNLSRAVPSAYGRGTTAADIAAGDMSLGFHEGSHGRDVLSFLVTHPFPTFTGADGMREDQFNRSMLQYQTAIQQYGRAFNLFALQTDCVGVTIEDFYRGRQQRSPVRCPVTPGSGLVDRILR